MKTLIIYDTTGYIILSQTGDYRVPAGIPYIEPDIPEGKYAVSVNVAIREPVLEDIPKTDDTKYFVLRSHRQLIPPAAEMLPRTAW